MKKQGIFIAAVLSFMIIFAAALSMFVFKGVKEDQTLTEEPETETCETQECTEPENETGSTPFDRYGRLSVKDAKLVDQDGNQVQLRGVSTHHLPSFNNFVNSETLRYVRDEWGVNLIRLATYTEYFGEGYCEVEDKISFDGIIKNGIKVASDLGMYVIVDWHTLLDSNPLKHLGEAKDFFSAYSTLLSDRDNIIYEICNEPNGETTWADIKQYAETIIPIIRRNDPDAVILIPPAQYTTDWDSVKVDPLKFKNIMYTTHFYAGSHKQELRDKVASAVEDGFPVFISECNVTEADMQGSVDDVEGTLWFDLLDSNKLSYTVWSFSDFDECFSFFRNGLQKLSGFEDEDLTDAGRWNVSHFKKLKWSEQSAL